MTMAQDQPNRRTYRGNCHCGGFEYEVDLPELRAVVECDCSFCSRTGNLYVLTDDDSNFRIVKGTEEGLKSYTFGPGHKIHKFCPKCATSLLSRMPNGPPRLKLLLNTRALQNVDVDPLERRKIFNSKIGPPYIPPEHKGDIPPNVDGGQLYTGSCHCGAVTVALSCKPLNESSEEKAVICSCSICHRDAYVWLFPRPTNMVLSGSEDAIGRYTFPDGLTSKTFCRTCGVNLTNPRTQLSQDKALAPSEHSRQVYSEGKEFHPVNARVLHGVDLGGLKKGRVEGATVMLSTYSNL
ncbi:Mss4-like protein [Trichoderma chlorosporum]